MTRHLTTRLLCERYSVTDRTIDRWVASGILPRPMQINRRRYWDEAEIEQLERERIAKNGRSHPHFVFRTTAGQQRKSSGSVG